MEVNYEMLILTYCGLLFKDFSGTFKDLMFSSTFKGLEIFFCKFKHFEGFLKHAMNPVIITAVVLAFL